MKKNFFKKLAFVLAFVLTVTSLNYVPASAAATPAWKAKKSVISLMGSYAYGVKNVPSKGKVTWKTGNKEVATVSRKGSLTAVGEGTTTLKATVKNKAGKTVKTLTQKVTVKAPVWTATKDTLKEGERTTFTKQYTAKGAKVKFASSNTEVAKVSQKGSVLAVKAGKTTITATFSMNGEEYATLTKDVTVEAIETAIQSVAQNTTTKLTATFVGDTKDVKADNFSIVRADNVVVTVKSATVDKTDATKVVLETYAEMKDGKEYTVTFKGTKESTAKFKATDGTVADVNVTPVTITAATEKTIAVQTLDANGVVVEQYDLGAANMPSSIDFTITTTNGYTTNSKLYLPEVGNTATAKVTYHTFKYDEKGVETGKIEKQITITAVADDSSVSNFKYTIGEQPNWNKTFTANTKIAIGEKEQAYFCIKDSKDTDVTKNYTVSSSNSSKVLIEGSLTDSSTGLDIVAVEEGTAYILIKDSKGNVVASLPVTIIAKKAATALELNKTSLSVAKEGTVVSSLKATVKDQYGNEMNKGQAYEELTIDVLNAPSVAAKAAAAAAAVGDKDTHEITVTPSSLDVKGSYTIKVTAKVAGKSVSRVFTLVVVDTTGATVSNKIDLDNTKVDTTVTNETNEDAVINVKVAQVQNGVTTGYEQSVESVTVKKADGSVIAGGANDVNCAGITIKKTAESNNVAVIKALSKDSKDSKEYTKNLAAGNYTVTVVVNGKTLTTGFVVTDSQATPAVVVKKTAVSEGTLKAALANTDYVAINYEGTIQDSLSASDIMWDDGQVVDNVSTAVVKTIKVKITLTGGNKVVVNVPINKVFTGFTGLGL